MNIDTKRLASDPGYWRECGAGNYQFAFTTGPEWDGAFEYIGRVEFADEDGRQGSDIWSPRLQIGPKSWTLVAVRPQEDDAADQEKRILVETFVAGPGRDLIILGDSERVMRHGDGVEIYLTRSRESESGWADGPKGDGVSDDTSAIQNILSPGSEAKWDGEGLPPVGRDFEIDVQTATLWHAGGAWRQCEILAHRGGKAICWVPTCNTVISTSNAEHFRPIRTKEQRQRDEVIAAAEHAIESHGGAVASSANLEWLYDAGLLRKPEGD